MILKKKTDKKKKERIWSKFAPIVQSNPDFDKKHYKSILKKFI